MQRKQQPPFQIFIQSVDLQTSTQTLTLNNPEITFHDLKSYLLPSHHRSFYFSHNGKLIPDSSTILDSRIAPLSTVDLRFRLPGGGGDGGATGAESRDCYLNMYAVKKPDKVDPNEQRLSKWTTCSLSSEPLRPPCVVDKLGNLFNKESLVEALLGKKLPKEFGHIKGLKDMINIQLEQIPNGDVVCGTRFHCPITGLEFNGKCRFFVLRSCGHVLSAKALKEVKSSACLVCHKAFFEDDKIVINGNPEEVANLREKIGDEKAKVRGKKVKRLKNDDVNGVECLALDSESTHLSGSKRGVDFSTGEKALGKMETSGQVVNGNGALKSANDGPAKRFKATDLVPRNATKEVYASIFTSSKKSSFKETYSCRSLPLGRN